MRQLKDELRNLLKDYTSAATHTTTLYLTIKVTHTKVTHTTTLYLTIKIIHIYSNSHNNTLLNNQGSIQFLIQWRKIYIFSTIVLVLRTPNVD